MTKLSFIALLSITTMASVAHSSQPLDIIQGSIDRCIKILNDPKYQDPAEKDLQRERLWEIIQEIFDFTELAKRTLGTNWRSFSQDQREEFTDALAEFLGNVYLDKLEGKYNAEKVVYCGEVKSTDSRAFVETKILKGTAEILVGYRMRKHNGSWRIYDVDIGGVSLVMNYRAQFQKILSRNSPDYLIQRLKEKVERLEEDEL